LIRMVQDTATNILEKSLDASSLRQQAIANNIANVDTPGYKRELVDFEERLQEALFRGKRLKLNKTDSAHLGKGIENPERIEAEIYKDQTRSIRVDDNNVDVDMEIALFAENTLKFSTMTRAINDKFAKIDSAIKGRG